MELQDVILGFMDWKQLTGYELKSFFSELDFLPWAGNNNQIYTALLKLEREGLVEKETVPQEKLPPQKRYRATGRGKERLKCAVLQPAEAISVRNDFLLHLAWSDGLSTEEIERLVDGYQKTIEVELAMCREKMRRGGPVRGRSRREEYVWSMILQNREALLRAELNWLIRLRNGLANK